MKKNQVQEAFKRFMLMYFGKNTPKEKFQVKQMENQFTYFMINKNKKKEFLKENSNFVPIRINKLASKIVRTGRIS